MIAGVHQMDMKPGYMYRSERYMAQFDSALFHYSLSLVYQYW